jgi:hypothetical protein
MDAGNMAQWAAATLALILGIRSEVRAWRRRQREENKDKVEAISQVITLFRELAKAMPREVSEVLSHEQRKTLQRLAETGRKGAGGVAAAYPTVAAELIDLADKLEDFALLTPQGVLGAESSKRYSSECAALYHALLMLSIPIATRVSIKGELVGLATIYNDPYYKLFRERYEYFRRQRKSSLW